MCRYVIVPGDKYGFMVMLWKSSAMLITEWCSLLKYAICLVVMVLLDSYLKAS